MTRGHAVQLATAFGHVHFTIARAFGFGFGCFGDSGGLAVGSGHTFAIGVPQVALLTEASDLAVFGADGTRLRVSACGGAGRTARAEDLVFAAFRWWWHHQELLRASLVALFLGDALSLDSVAQMSVFAGATGYADTRADGIGIVAGAIASAALTEFFVIRAHSGWQRHSFGGWDSAFLRFHANTVFVLEEAGFAETSDDAVLGAYRTGMRIGASGSACRTASQEQLVVLALRHFRRVGE